VRHLAPGTTHSFTVRARDGSGNTSVPSAALTITLPASTDTTPPTAPVVTYGDTSPGCSFIDLGWNASTDDSGAALEYELYEDGSFMALGTGEVPEASFGRHSYAVRAVDPSGNASPLGNAIVLDLGNTC
jgi:chitodextrinase